MAGNSLLKLSIFEQTKVTITQDSKGNEIQEMLAPLHFWSFCAIWKPSIKKGAWKCINLIKRKDSADEIVHNSNSFWKLNKWPWEFKKQTYAIENKNSIRWNNFGRRTTCSFKKWSKKGEHMVKLILNIQVRNKLQKYNFTCTPVSKWNLVIHDKDNQTDWLNQTTQRRGGSLELGKTKK